jgi:hypothetical protein
MVIAMELEPNRKLLPDHLPSSIVRSVLVAGAGSLMIKSAMWHPLYIIHHIRIHD